MPDITLSLTPAVAARVGIAFGGYWHLKNPDGMPRAATAAEIKEYLIRQLRAVVIQQERRTAESALPAIPGILID